MRDEVGRAEDRAVDVRLGGEVDDRARSPAPRPRDGRRVGDVALDGTRARRPRGSRVAGVGELVEHDDLVAGGGEPPGEVRADEAGAAGDEHAHAGEQATRRCRGEALAQAVAPVRQLGRALLGAQHRVRRPRRLRAELGGRDPPHAAVEPGLLEDRLGEVGPRAVARRRRRGRRRTAARRSRASPRRDGRRRSGSRAGRRRPRPRRARRRAAASCGRSCGRSARRATSERTIHACVAGRRLAVQLRPAVDAERVRRVRLDVRLALRAVEDVVGREVDERHAELGDVLRAADVHRRRALRVVLGAVDVRPGRRVQDELESQAARARGSGKRTSHSARVERERLRERLGERRAELPAGAGDQDAAALSRSESSGDRVLQRSTTRGSFHGTPCSSGSAGSYSSVTR